MKTILKIKNINSITHESVEFICIFVYFLNKVKNDTTVLIVITKEIYFVENLKIKMLIENDSFDSEKFVINIETRIAIIESCKINISLKIQFKNSYIRRTIHTRNVFILQSKKKQLTLIRIKVLEERKFFFKSNSNAKFIMCSQRSNTNTK